MKPIIMSAESVRAILDGRKTQTRRVVKPQPEPLLGDPSTVVWPHHHNRSVYGSYSAMAIFMARHSPYPIGSRVWVRETWTRARTWTGKPWIYKAELTAEEWARREEIAKRNPPDPSGYVLRWNSPIFMPRRASRITLEVTGVRAERLQEITEADVDAEGFNGDFPGRAFPSVFTGDWDYYGQFSMPECYGILWDSINGKRYPWDSNPWVWVVEFRRGA